VNRKEAGSVGREGLAFNNIPEREEGRGVVIKAEHHQVQGNLK